MNNGRQHAASRKPARYGFPDKGLRHAQKPKRQSYTSPPKKEGETSNVEEIEYRREQSSVWVILALIVVALVFFLTNEQYIWIPFLLIIGVIVLTQLKGFYWRQHLFPILAGVLLLGSWVAQNTAEAKWTAEKAHVTTWLQLQESKFVDLGQWQIAVQQYRYPYEKIPRWEDILKKDRNYASLCKNWLQLYHSFIIIDSQINMDLTRSEKLDQQVRLASEVEQMDRAMSRGDYEPIIDLYDSEMQHSFHVIGDSGNRVLLRLEEIEKKQKISNRIFAWLYALGSLLLAINYVLKEIVKHKSINQGTATN